MKFFKRKRDVIDLGEKYRRQQEKLNQLKENLSDNSGNSVASSSSNSGGFVNFFGNMSSAATTTPEFPSTDNIESAHERKRKLAKKLVDLTSKIEDLNNQIYHLQQRIEVLERKSNTNSY